MSMVQSVPMSPESAHAVFDVLVEQCGASESSREDFVFHQTNRFCTEYRFVGSLGMGGKFWRTHSHRADGSFGEHWYVSNYTEDQTTRTRAAIAATAITLDDLRAAHEQVTPLVAGERA